MRGKSQTRDFVTRGNEEGRPYIDLELRPAELQAVGRVTTNWAFFEFLLLRETRGLASFLEIDLPEDAAAISFRRRRQVWQALVEQAAPWLPTATPRSLDCIAQAKALAVERHKITHDILEYDRENPNRLKSYSRETFGRFGWPLDAARIERLAMDIARLNHAMLALYRPLEPVAYGRKQGTRGLRDSEPLVDNPRPRRANPRSRTRPK